MKYETNCADRGVMVMQALMLVVIIAQKICKKTTAVAEGMITAVAGKGRFEMAMREQANRTEQEAKVAAATGIPKMQRMGQGLEGENIKAAAAMKHMERTERLERSYDVEMQEMAASKRSAWIQPASRTRRPAAMAITAAMLVITILASAEAGMTENAGAQVAGLQSVCMEEAENARTTAHSQTQQVMKSDREQRLEAKEVDELTAKLGELRLTIDKIGELNREECIRLIIVNLARLSTKQEWNGLLG